MRWNPEMQQFVRDDEVLKARFLFDQVMGECYNAGGRAGTPLPGHSLHANNPRLGLQTL
jgi:hypothetical protein